MERPEVFDPVGVLANEPPGVAGLPFISSSDDFTSIMTTRRTGLARTTSNEAECGAAPPSTSERVGRHRHVHHQRPEIRPVAEPVEGGLVAVVEIDPEAHADGLFFNKAIALCPSVGARSTGTPEPVWPARVARMAWQQAVSNHCSAERVGSPSNIANARRVSAVSPVRSVVTKTPPSKGHPGHGT